MYRDFADALLKAMTDKQIKQEKMAELIGVSREMISAYICGKSLPSAKTAIKIAEKLKSPALEWDWLRSNQVGAKRLPKIHDVPLSQCYLNLHCAAIRTINMHQVLSEICRDNRIDQEEISVYSAGAEHVEELVSFGLAFINEKTTLAGVAR